MIPEGELTHHRFKTVTFKNNPTLIKEVIQIFVEEATPVLSITGLAPAFAFQPISLNIIENMSKNGGNVLGLSDADGPITSISPSPPLLTFPQKKELVLTSP
jgi:hypothetical protein